MLNFIWASVCVILLTVSAIIEKYVVNNHSYVHFSFARLFYMLVISLFVMILIEPGVLTTKAFKQSMTDGNLILVGIVTALGLLIYYWLLKKQDLYIVTLLWPIMMVLTIIGANIFLKEALTMAQWIGIFVTFVGLTIILINKKT